jgi:transcriptional regulator with XRE-family HTH domain
MDNNSEDIGLLPLDFPEDNEPEDLANDQIEEKTVKIVPEKKDVIEAEKLDAPDVKDKKKQESAGKNSKDGKVNRSVKDKNIPPAKIIESLNTPVKGTFTPGHILQEGRVRADLSIEQVAQETKINKKYIISLEMGDTDNLPPGIYVEAYIKHLCKVYKLDPSQVLASMKLDGGAHKVPGEILQDIEKGKQVNVQEEARVRKIVKVTGVALVLILISIFLIFKFSNHSENNKKAQETVSDTQEKAGADLQPEKSISAQDLEIFLAPQPFTMTELKVPE